MDCKKNCDLVRRVVVYELLICFGIPLTVVSLIKICLSETYNNVWVDKVSVTCPIRHGLKEVDAESPFLFNFRSETGRYFLALAFCLGLEYAVRKV
jgi:hypothetical protein